MSEGSGPRRRRKDAADAAVGLHPAGAGRWGLPGVGLDVWFVMRLVPAHHRLGFREWVAVKDGRQIVHRRPGEWDRLYAAFGAAETT